MAYPATDNGVAAGAKPLRCVPRRFELTARGGSGSAKRVTCVLDRVDKNSTSAVDQELVSAMWQLLNFEIVEMGNSYPLEKALTRQQFLDFYMASETFALRLIAVDGSESAASWPHHSATGRLTGASYDFGRRLVGCFYVKPNFPGRSAHIANGGFLVVPSMRGLKVGEILGRAFLDCAAELGYKGTMFNLVYRHNPRSVRLWQKLGFTHSGTIRNAGRVLDGEGKEVFSDALQFYYDLDKHREEMKTVSKL